MSQQSGTSIGFIILGFFLGGFAAGIIINFAGPLSDEVIVVISMACPLLGIRFGFFLSWLSVAGKNKAVVHERQEWKARNAPVQIVGKSCSICQSRMMMASDGRFCPRCKRVVCTNCAPQSTCEYCRP